MNARYCQALAALALYTAWSAGVYYFYALNYRGIFLALASTAVSFILLKPQLNCNDASGNSKIQIPNSKESTKNKEQSDKTGLWGLFFGIWNFFGTWNLEFVFFGLSALNLLILFSSRIAAAIISPWQVIPSYFFITVTITTALLVAIALKRDYPSTTYCLLLTVYVFQLFSIAAIVYAVGFGFDPFIHQATERLIAATGAVDPKPLYYLGQYGLVVTLHKLTFISVITLDTWLVPVLAALLLPWAGGKAARAMSDNSAVKRLAMLGLAALPFPLFTLTTPQNLSYLFVALLILLSVARHSLGLLMALAAAALATHPLTGIPAALFVTLYAVSRRELRYRRSALAAVTILAAIAVPLALTVNNRTNAVLQNGNNAAVRPWGAELWTGGAPFFSGLENAVLNLSYLYGFNAAYLIVLLTVMGIILWLHGSDNRKAALLPYALTAFALAVSYALTTRVDTSYLIAYERSAFADRLLVLAALFALPLMLTALVRALHAVLEQERAVRYAWLAFLAVLPTAALYHSYPRFDNYLNSRSYSTSRTDIEAVRWIEADAAGEDYVVLANQQVSAAALRELGFKKYYETARGDVFFYPIPTGEALYQYYLDMVYEKADKKTAAAAAELTGVRTVYFVLNDYWWAFDKVRAEAALTADAIYTIDDSRSIVFKYNHTHY